MVKTVHFRVANGDMTLVELESGRRILIDINIRAAADDPDDDTPDVAKQLRERLDRDDKGRLYVDAFLLDASRRGSHPRPQEAFPSRRPRRLVEDGRQDRDPRDVVLADRVPAGVERPRAVRDANAWATEARRRVKLFRDGHVIGDGNRIMILGEDVDGKTDDLGAILVKTDETFPTICGVHGLLIRGAAARAVDREGRGGGRDHHEEQFERHHAAGPEAELR